MIQVGRDMGIFNALYETKKKMKIDEIADKVSADPKLVGKHRYADILSLVQIY